MIIFKIMQTRHLANEMGESQPLTSQQLRISHEYQSQGIDLSSGKYITPFLCIWVLINYITKYERL